MIPPRWTIGSTLAAGPLDAQREETRAGRLTVDPASGLELVGTPSGRLLRASGREPIHGTLSGAGPSYTFVESQDLGGTWSAGPTAGTAYEVNGVTGLAGTRQWLRPDGQGAWRFQSLKFGGGTGGGSGGIGDGFPFCYCPDPPATLAMVSSDPLCNFRMFQSCTIQYGPTPAEFVPLNIGPNNYFSTTSFPDPLADGALFYYLLTCQQNFWILTRIYPTSPYGSPYRDAILYTWIVNTNAPFVPGQNTCGDDRLNLQNPHLYGAFAGSDLSCSVTING